MASSGELCYVGLRFGMVKQDMVKQDMGKTFTIPELLPLRFSWYKRLPLELWRPLRQYVYLRDKGECQYCHSKVELHKCHCHHVLELSEGGTNHPTNLKILCVKCHKKRHPFMLTAKDKLCG